MPAFLFLVLALALAQHAAAQRSAAEIGDYQIILWTSILLVLILLAVIYNMLYMDSRRDPALYAQVIDPRAAAGKKSN